MKNELIDKIVNFKTGRRYEGQTLYGVPCGNGKLYSKDNKVIYEGYWMAGKPHGYGTYTNDEEVFKGFFQKGFKHGFGIIYNNNGELIEEGLWAFGLKDKSIDYGNYIFIAPKAKIEKDLILPDFKKFWNNTKILKDRDRASLYVGELDCERYHGMAYAEYKNDCFLGKYRDGKMHGYCVYTHSNGDVYCGKFMNGYREGTGTYYFANGDYYVGEWKENQKHGNGKFFDHENRLTFEGTWQFDNQNGDFVVRDESNNIVENHYYEMGILRTKSNFENKHKTINKNEIIAFKNQNMEIIKHSLNDKAGLAILNEINSSNCKYIVGKFENNKLVPGYAEFYDEDTNLLLAGVVNSDGMINGYGVIMNDEMFYEGFFENSKSLNSGIEFLNYNSIDPNNPKMITLFYNVDNHHFQSSDGPLIETPKMHSLLLDIVTSQVNNMVPNDESYEEKKNNFFERQAEFLEIFKDTVPHFVEGPINKYLNVKGSSNNPTSLEHKPLKKEHEDKKTMKVNIKTQEEMEKFINKKFEELDLVGLDNVKEQLKNIFALKVLQGEHYKLSDMNMAFIGNPGTGKSTVANIVTELLYEMGVIEENKCINVSFKDLYGAYVGHSLKAINEKIEKAKGGVFFLDEAHQLDNSESHGNNTFSKEIMNALITSLENNRKNTVFIFAGYRKEMKNMLSKADKGLASRIGRTVVFDDFNEEDLAIIFTRMLGEEKNYAGESFTIDEGAILTLYHLIESIKYQKGSNFGNARDVRILVRKVLEGFARTTTDRDNTIITNDDFEKIFNGKIKIYEDKKDIRELN